MRLFLGLLPDAPQADATARLQDSVRWPTRAKPVRRENLHLTLHFLGEVDPAGLPALEAAVAVDAPPLAFTLDRFEVWPGGIAVLEPSIVAPALLQLHARLAEGLALAGCTRDARPWRPHVTLAHHAQGAQPPADAVRIAWSATRFALVRSQAGRYLPLRQFELSPPRY